jgi:hypothetical protein
VSRTRLTSSEFDVLTHDVFPATRLGVNLFPRQSDDVDEKAFGQAVLAHHRHGQSAALVAQFQMAITGHVQQTVALHAGHGLAHGGTTLLETFGDSGAQRYDALFLKVVDRPQVHLGGIDQIVHSQPSVAFRVYR